MLGASEERVHTFTASEIRHLYLACQTLFERLLMTALFERSLRKAVPLHHRNAHHRVLAIARRAVAEQSPVFRNLRWPPGNRAGCELHTVEKGNVRTREGAGRHHPSLVTVLRAV